MHSKVYREVMTSQAMTSYMRIGELANVVGLSPDTIRYYERVDLLPPPARTPSGYRIYSTQAVDRLRFIQGAQRLGLKLDDIRDLLCQGPVSSAQGRS